MSLEENPESIFSQNDYPILLKERWDATRMDEKIHRIIEERIFNEYKHLREHVPKRRKNFFSQQTRNGELTTCPDTKRIQEDNLGEEYLALALYNLGKDLHWHSPKSNVFHLIDYQFPLKFKKKSNGIGEVDLLGLTYRGQLTVIELKVSKDGGAKANPLSTLIQGLRYSAIIEANLDLIICEARAKGLGKILKEPPIIQLFADKVWWDHWLVKWNQMRGNWKLPFDSLLKEFESELNIDVECIALELTSKNIHWVSKRKPILDHIPNLFPVSVAKNEPFGILSNPY